MSETFARDCQVNVRMDKMSLLAAGKKPMNEEEISETFAFEWTNVNTGH